MLLNGAPLRVMLAFIIRMSGAARATRFFANQGVGLDRREAQRGLIQFVQLAKLTLSR